MAKVTPKKRQSAKRRRGESNELVSPNPQPKKQAKKSTKIEDVGQGIQPVVAPAPEATAASTIGSTTASTRAERLSSAFHRVSAAVMFKPILKEDEQLAAEAQTNVDDMVPPPMINNPTPQKSPPHKASTCKKGTKSAAAKASPQETQHADPNKASDRSAPLDSDVHISLSWKGQPLLHWKDKRQMYRGMGSLVLSLLLLSFSLVLVLQSYFRATCRLSTWELRQKLLILEPLVDSRHTDRKLFQHQEQQIRMWRQETSSKQAQMIGIQQQCKEDWERVQKCSCGAAETAEVKDAIEEDLRALQEPAIAQQLEELQVELAQLRLTNEELEHAAVEQEKSLADMAQTLELEHQSRSATSEVLAQALNDRDSLQRELSDLQLNIQDYSKDRLTQWLDEGPYQVEMQLKFADDAPDIFRYMTIDLDGQYMPHSVYTFLSQVDAGAYNSQERPNFAFHHNGIHIVFGSPYEPDDWSSRLPRLLFQEYSDQVPHEALTMGWSGMGPDLYVNVRDNTEMHGAIRDPCFGRIIRGEAVVNFMHGFSGEMEESDWKELPADIVVVSIDIL